MRHSRNILNVDFTPEVTEKDVSFTTSDSIDKTAEDNLGPSAFSGTGRPYLARLFEMGSQEIMEMGLMEPLETVDKYILEIIQDRSWKDTADSYKSVLSELKQNFGIHEQVENLFALERLARMIPLLRAQKRVRARDEKIKKQIIKEINKYGT